MRTCEHSPRSPLLAVVATMIGTTGVAQTDPLARARALHKQVPLIDGHNDYPWALRGLDPGRDFAKADITGSVPKLMTDIPRLAPGRRRRPVLVGLRALDDAGQGGGARDARTDRHRASHDAALAGDVRDWRARRPRSSAPSRAAGSRR